MKNKTVRSVIIMSGLLTVLIFQSCAPLKEFGSSPVFEGANNFSYSLPDYDSAKKTVVVVANNDGTELFDMMAPYYLFNATGKANVYIIAKEKAPIVVKKGLFVLPQFTFKEIDSLNISPDVIVIPFLSVIDSVDQDPYILEWIKSHYSINTTILSVCDGSATAAATGLYDYKPITAHASDFAMIKRQFSKPLWIQNNSVVGSDNLFSTAGVSNATEGSLIVINNLFGKETMQKVIDDVQYSYSSPKMEHTSNTFRFADKASVAKKIMFRKNRRIGVLLQNNINEFDLSAILDTYNRTFPKSIESFSENDSAVTTKYGLTILPTGKIGRNMPDEIHVIASSSFSLSEKGAFSRAKIVNYDLKRTRYIIDECLIRIRDMYGAKFQGVVKLMLDYN